MKKSSVRLSVILLLTLAVLLQSVLVSLAANGKKESGKVEKSYEIAVVFDNSGSIYRNKGWCRAKYAMEIFASMLNYEKDVLKIFPMWEVVTDGSEPESGGSVVPIEIRSQKDIDKISKLYTPEPDNTPLEPIDEAYNTLVNSSAQEKWLVVLTDGSFNLEKRQRNVNAREYKTEEFLTTYLKTKASEKIKVQYLGIGEAMALVPDETNYFYSKKSDDASLKDDLIKICNQIFQRDELPSKYINGNKLNIDLSMKNVIVFAQGDGAVIGGLVGSDGKTVEKTLDSGQRKYSTISCGGDDYACPVDETLAGQVVSFAACPKGEYTLEISGAEKMQIFYEPDVDISLTMKNSDGQEVDYKSDEIAAGDYSLEFGLVDAVTGEDVTGSDLMGNTNIKGIAKTSDGSETEFRSGETVTLNADEQTDIVIEGTYLEKYTISTEDNPDFSLSFKVNLPEKNKLEINVYTTQSGAWYKLNDSDNWQPIRVDVAIDGAPLTDEQLKELNLNMEFSKDVVYSYKMLPGQSAYEVYVGTDESGKFVAPKQGNYVFKASAKIVDEYGQESADEAKAKFEIRSYDKMWKWLFWLIILGVLLLVTVFIMTRKAWPKEMYLDCNGGLNDIDIGEEINLASNAFPGVLACSAKKASMLYQRGGKSAAIKIVDVSPMYSVTSFKIGASKRYQKDSSGQFVDNNGKGFSEAVVRHGTKIEITRTKGSAIVGKINMNG